MWEELVAVGLEPSEARFYLAALETGRASVSQISEAANVSRTNGYDLTRRLAKRGLVSLAEQGPSGQPSGRGKNIVIAADPIRLLAEHQETQIKLADLVPRLSAIRAKGASRPRVRYFEGGSGMRQGLMETLNWEGPLLGILSMRDMLEVPGEAAMNEYIEGRRQRKLQLQVIRSSSRDQAPGWPTSAKDFRIVRTAPTEHTFSVSTIIGAHMVAVFSTPAEAFAMVIESPAYAQMQADLFHVLWDSCSPFVEPASLVE